MWNFLLVPLLGTIVPFSHGVSLKPGQPGGPWTKEEVEIAVEKVGLLRDIISSSFCGSLVAFGGTIRVKKKSLPPIFTDSKNLITASSPGSSNAGLRPRVLAQSPSGQVASRRRARRLQSSSWGGHLRTKVLRNKTGQTVHEDTETKSEMLPDWTRTKLTRGRTTVSAATGDQRWRDSSRCLDNINISYNVIIIILN